MLERVLYRVWLHVLAEFRPPKDSGYEDIKGSASNTHADTTPARQYGAHRAFGHHADDHSAFRGRSARLEAVADGKATTR